MNVIDNRVLMQRARESLSGHWGIAIGTTVVYLLIESMSYMIEESALGFDSWGAISSLLISGPMELGWSIFLLRLIRNQSVELNMLFMGFKRFGTAVWAYILTMVFVLLWSLLLIVPGIIVALSYSQVYYIIADDTTISATDAIKKSKSMMLGYKGKYLCLLLRFIGWILLSMLTGGIGFLWVLPYISVSTAQFYEDISR